MIGEHTDYNGGLVLPTALKFGTYVLISRRQDGVFRLVSNNFSNKVSFRVDQLTYSIKEAGENYPKGVIKFLLDPLNPEDRYQLSMGADLLYQGGMLGKSNYAVMLRCNTLDYKYLFTVQVLSKKQNK